MVVIGEVDIGIGGLLLGKLFLFFVLLFEDFF